MYEVIYINCFLCNWSLNPNIISKITQVELIYFWPLMPKESSLNSEFIKSRSLNLSQLTFLMSWCIKSKLSAKLLKISLHWSRTFKSSIFCCSLTPLSFPKTSSLPTNSYKALPLAHHSCCCLGLNWISGRRLLAQIQASTYTLLPWSFPPWTFL